ncbi:MAG: homocysteine S-methyltransferase family protein [Woeseiaceae bacterium]|nr:homocysteine S-methyltransferase family protein [Woeseiaceae bacterium]
MCARKATSPGLLERLEDGTVICAEGYLFELERRGYIQAGAFVPEVVLEHPEKVAELHREFVHAGSDVVEAFTYYAHREKLRVIGKEDLLETMNRNALAIAAEVADESGTLLGGNICNTNIWVPDDTSTHKAARAMFEEQVGWAVDAGADFIIGETFCWVDEALAALAVIKDAGKPAVMTFGLDADGLHDGADGVTACKRLADAGAEVVGLNCSRGPDTMLPVIREIRAAVSCHVAALPVPYRTSAETPTFQLLRDKTCNCIPEIGTFPTALDAFTCNRYEIAEFTRQVHEIGVNYLGLCCGAGPHHVRSMAEALGRQPPASRYSPDMSKHAYQGSDENIPSYYKSLGKMYE